MSDQFINNFRQRRYLLNKLLDLGFTHQFSTATVKPRGKHFWRKRVMRFKTPDGKTVLPWTDSLMYNSNGTEIWGVMAGRVKFRVNSLTGEVPEVKCDAKSWEDNIDPVGPF